MSGPMAPPVLSKFRSSATTESRFRQVQFGDGYAQRSPDGINSLALNFNAAFNSRPLEEIREIEKFLRGNSRLYPRQPHEYFFFYPPEGHDWAGGAPMKVICQSWKATPGEGRLASLEAVFQQVYDL